MLKRWNKLNLIKRVDRISDELTTATTRILESGDTRLQLIEAAKAMEKANDWLIVALCSLENEEAP